MAINRFFKPVDYEYTPIPFQELVLLGKYYADERKQAEEDLAANIKTFGKFVSPSQADMENYQRESIGKLTPFLEQAAANPGVMKDTMWRSQMQAAINNIDYAKLGMYELSAANLNARLLNIAKMKAAGKYNLNWDDLNISAWNSDQQGVMNDLIPIEYQSLEAFGTPYVDKIQPTFYKGVDPNNPKNKLPYTNWMSVTYDDIARSFAQHIDDIKADPQGGLHYRDITDAYLKQHPNATQEELDNVFVNALTTRQLDKVRSTPIVDLVGLKFAAAKYAHGLATGGDDDPQQPEYISPRKQLSNQYMSNFNDYVKKNITDPTRKDYAEDQRVQRYNQMGAHQENALADMLERLGEAPEKVQYHRMLAIKYGQAAAAAQLHVNRKEFSNMYGSDKIGPEDFDEFNKRIDIGKFEKVSKDLIDNMGGQITLTDSHNMIKHIATPTKVIWSGGESEGFALSHSAEVVLPFRLASAILGLKGKTAFDNSKFIRAFEQGLYKNIKIIPQALGTVVFDADSPSGKREYIKATAIVNLNNVNLDLPWWTFSDAGETAEKITIERMGYKINPDTNEAELEVYVPIGETSEQAEDFNFEKNKDRFGVNTNAGDRYVYTYRTNQQRLNTGYYGEEE